MNTTTAAAKANVTAATIRTWCRRNAIAAVKTAGRWDIDEASLNRRIALSHRRATAIDIEYRSGVLVAVGKADVLRTAFQNKLPVSIVEGTYTGSTVHLGLKAGGRGTQGLVVTYTDGTVGYAIDTSRLQQAPAVAAFITAADDQVFIDGFADQAAENAYLNPRYM